MGIVIASWEPTSTYDSDFKAVYIKLKIFSLQKTISQLDGVCNFLYIPMKHYCYRNRLRNISFLPSIVSYRTFKCKVIF